jgi:hypothetical protein
MGFSAAAAAAVAAGAAASQMMKKPKTPDVTPAPPAPTAADPAVAKAAADETARVRGGGRSSTIMTSPLGVADDQEKPSKKLLLGA